MSDVQIAMWREELTDIAEREREAITPAERRRLTDRAANLGRLIQMSSRPSRRARGQS